MPPEYRFSPTVGMPPAVQDVVDRAISEWRRWGRQIVDYRAIDWARTRAVRELVQPGVRDLPTGETAPGDGEGPVVPVLAAAGCWENDPRMFRALREYWRPLQDRGTAADTAGRRERHLDDLIDSAVAVSLGRPPGWTEAWSAAFISYLVSPSAGGTDRTFGYSRSHAEYVAAAVAETWSGTGAHRYAARPVATFAPRSGDLICSYRAQPRREPWASDMADWRLGAGHCDVVVAIETSAGAGRVFAVGGNIFQSVSVSVHALRADGRLHESRFRNWAIVLADRANPVGLAGPSAAADR